MNEMRKRKPEEFRKTFRKRKNNVKHDIANEDFYNYFKELASEKVDIQNEPVQEFMQNFYSSARETTFEELDEPITQDEIKKAINGLTPNKSCGTDDILNEYFIHAANILIDPLEKLFNKIFESGIFPRQWSTGVIVFYYSNDTFTLKATNQLYSRPYLMSLNFCIYICC